MIKQKLRNTVANITPRQCLAIFYYGSFTIREQNIYNGYWQKLLTVFCIYFRKILWANREGRFCSHNSRPLVYPPSYISYLFKFQLTTVAYPWALLVFNLILMYNSWRSTTTPFFFNITINLQINNCLYYSSMLIKRLVLYFFYGLTYNVIYLCSLHLQTFYWQKKLFL